MSVVLKGVKILDFSALFPGPYGTMLLADMGAEVLRVSSKGKKDIVLSGSPRYADMDSDMGVLGCALGRNKKSISLNLKRPEAVEIVKQLVQEYDIVVEQFRPGVMERLGLGYEQLRLANEKIIYVSLTGYGQTGPYRMRAGHDINYLALSGVMSYSGRKHQVPGLMGMQVADLAGGSMNMVAGLLAALVHRDRTGEGQHVDVSMLDGMISYTMGAGTVFLETGRMPSPESERTAGSGLYDFYECADGRVLSFGGLEPQFFRKFCEGIGMPELADGGCNPPDIARVKPMVIRRIKEKTLAEWMDIFRDLDACVEPVCSLKDTYEENPHVRERGMITEIPRFDGKGTVKQIANPIKFSACANRYECTAVPVGYHQEEILTKLGYSKEEREELRESGVFS